MNTENDTLDEPQPELRRRQIPAGAARVAVFTRTYDAAVEDVWDACTNPERLRRWYGPVSGDLRLGGHFKQALMSSGVILACDPPQHLKLSLGDGADEIELRLTSAEDGKTVLELEHATTMDRHDIAGETSLVCLGSECSTIQSSPPVRSGDIGLLRGSRRSDVSGSGDVLLATRNRSWPASRSARRRGVRRSGGRGSRKHRWYFQRGRRAARAVWVSGRSPFHSHRRPLVEDSRLRRGRRAPPPLTPRCPR